MLPSATTDVIREPRLVVITRWDCCIGDDRAMWKHVKAVILLPFMVTVVIPAIILYSTGIGGIALQRPVPWNVLMVVGAEFSSASAWYFS